MVRVINGTLNKFFNSRRVSGAGLPADESPQAPAVRPAFSHKIPSSGELAPSLKSASSLSSANNMANRCSSFRGPYSTQSAYKPLILPSTAAALQQHQQRQSAVMFDASHQQQHQQQQRLPPAAPPCSPPCSPTPRPDGQSTHLLSFSPTKPGAAELPPPTQPAVLHLPPPPPSPAAGPPPQPATGPPHRTPMQREVPLKKPRRHTAPVKSALKRNQPNTMNTGLKGECTGVGTTLFLPVLQTAASWRCAGTR